jgi:release factor glutamine methyltransferase
MTLSTMFAAALVRDAQRLVRLLALSEREARLEVELLLAHALGVTRAQLLAHPERSADAMRDSRYPEYLERRLAGEPIAYILGEREFYGLSFQVTPAVLIPRPETELLVEMALQCIEPAAPARVLDVGTGSGCIAISIARLRPRARVVATDLSEQALNVAKANASRHGAANVDLRVGDCYAPVAGEQFDVIVANPPYVAEGDPHLDRGDLRREPRYALVSGPDGLTLMRRLIAEAPLYLRPEGWLLVEHGYDQAGPVGKLLEAAGLRNLCSASDLAGVPRVASGRLTLKP